MGADRAVSEGEAKTGSTAFVAAIRFDAVERSEELGQHILRYARAMISDGDQGAFGLVGRGGHGDVDGCSRRGVANGIANDVFDGGADHRVVAEYVYSSVAASVRDGG